LAKAGARLVDRAAPPVSREQSLPQLRGGPAHRRETETFGEGREEKREREKKQNTLLSARRDKRV